MILWLKSFLGLKYSMDNFIKEKSCGAVVYKFDNELMFLILEHNSGHFSFPKGHVENDESESETAIREIKEETNIDVLLDTNFRFISTYSPKEGVIKDVIFFIAKAKTSDIVAQIEEIKSINWYSYSDSLNILTYDIDKELLKKAYDYLSK